MHERQFPRRLGITGGARTDLKRPAAPSTEVAAHDHVLTDLVWFYLFVARATIVVRREPLIRNCSTSKSSRLHGRSCIPSSLPLGPGKVYTTYRALVHSGLANILLSS